MSKPRSPKVISKSDFVSIGELAELSGVRYSTLKYYTEIGILPFMQEEEKRNRYYNKKDSIKRLKLIHKLKTKNRFYIPEIIDYIQNLDNNNLHV
jgi:DNA-binding transcriptional MerR regulator